MNNIQLTIQFDCSERLEKVLSSLAEGLNNLSQPSPTPTPRTRRTKSSSSVETKEEEAVAAPQTEVENPTTNANEEPTPKEDVVEQNNEAQDAAPKASDAAQVQEITNADIRKAMNECRVRVLGDKANDGILRKTLNDKLRDKVHELGCQSSTDLSQEQRVIFVKFCEEIPVMQTEDAPF